ncbi:MAG: excalibur calcium-binding domain-containing protein [Methylococcaceae bacterium]|nr:excalibur calcium-binding domain-containing protein [Methylococcaceae bacterium]
MNKVILVLILSIITGYGYYQYQENTLSAAPTISSIDNNEPTKSTLSSVENNESTEPVFNSNYKCDGRTYCAQMTSCEEATFFINNCPDTKRMDGNKDGVPCEKQWCH